MILPTFIFERNLILFRCFCHVGSFSDIDKKGYQKCSFMVNGFRTFRSIPTLDSFRRVDRFMNHFEDVDSLEESIHFDSHSKPLHLTIRKFIRRGI